MIVYVLVLISVLGDFIVPAVAQRSGHLGLKQDRGPGFDSRWFPTIFFPFDRLSNVYGMKAL